MSGRILRVPVLQKLLQAWPWWVLLLALAGVRLSKGAFFSDAYALLSRPFWPGSAQSEWLRAAQRTDQQARLLQVERDNQRLRGLLGLERGDQALVAAPVISREAGGWWQQLELGQGSSAGIGVGDGVLAGEVVIRSPGRTPVSFSMNCSRGRGVPNPTSRPWRCTRGTQTPRRLALSVSRATRAVLGVTLATRPISPPGASTPSPTPMPAELP